LATLLLRRSITALAAFAKSVSPATTIFFITEVATGLGLLNLNGLTQDLEWTGKGRFDGGFTVERDESKPTRTTSVLVDHQRGINNAAELHEEALEILLVGLLADTTNEDLARLFLLITGDCALGIDLDITLVCVHF
jgi:hypothetical protein